MLMQLSSALLLTLSAGLTEGTVEAVAEGFMFTEGPVWMDGALLFTDIPRDQIHKHDGTETAVFREPSGQANGLTLDNEGRLIAAEHKNRRVSRTEKDGSITVLASAWEGKKLHSPNDVVVRADGTIFFTDPPYGGNDAELDFQGVYAIMPDGTLKLLVKDFNRPNGLALSPDEKTLYVADTKGSHLRAFDVAEDGTLSNGRVHCELPGPDGIKVDVEGNIWATASDGVRVISPAGALLETVAVPKNPANCCFGGKDGKTLYITARTAVYKVDTTVAGILPGKK